MKHFTKTIAFDYCDRAEDSKTHPCTREIFEKLIDSEEVDQRCSSILICGDEETKKKAKTALPLICYNASFSDGHRCADSALDSGLFMLDVDNEPDQKPFDPWVVLKRLETHLKDYPEILLTHVSASQRGFHVIAKKVGMGSIEAEQRRLYNLLFYKLPPADLDTTPKSPASGSFLVPRSYFVHMNLDELFGGEFDPRYVAYLEKESKTAANEEPSNADETSETAANEELSNADKTSETAEEDEESDDDDEENFKEEVLKEIRKEKEEVDKNRTLYAEKADEEIKRLRSTISSDLKYISDIPYDDIVTELDNELGEVGRPSNRHSQVLEIARNLAYICKDEKHLLSIMPDWALVHKECASAVKSAFSYIKGKAIPAPLMRVLRRLMKDKMDKPAAPPQLPKDLPSSIKAILEPFPENEKSAMLIMALSMMGTLAGKVRFLYRDKHDSRLGFLSVLVAQQASGKSCMNRLKDDLMSELIKIDADRRQKKKEWDEAFKCAKDDEKPKDPHIGFPIINPQTTLSEFYRILDDLKGERAIIVAPEIDALRKQHNWSEWGTNERLGFETEMGGQDTKTPDATSASIPIAVNFAFSGTPLAVKRHFNNTEDGLVTRASIAQLQGNSDFDNMAKDRTEKNKQILLDIQHRLMSEDGAEEYVLPKLQDSVREWYNTQELKADLSGYEAIKTYDKRDASIAFRAGILFYILEGHRLTSRVIHGAHFVAEYCMFNHLSLFGEQMNKSIEANRKILSHTVRISASETAFARLPEFFNYEDIKQVLAEEKINNNNYRVNAMRWKDRGWAVEIDNKTLRKTQLGLEIIGQLD